MKITIYMFGKHGQYDASGIYEDGVIIVLPGSRICLDFADHVRGGKKKSLSYRNNPSFVDHNGFVLKECAFKSASTAAQFVAGRTINGLLAWKVNPNLDLKSWLDLHPEEMNINNPHSKSEKREPKAYIVPKNELLIKSLLVDNPLLTVKELAQISGLSENGVGYNLAKLKRKNEIKREGSKRYGCWKIISNE